MVFSSLEFLFVFLPVFFFVYAVSPGKIKNAVLFLSSLVFYACGAAETPLYIALLFVAVCVNWFVGLRLGAGRPGRKAWLIFGLIYDFFWLLLFKYSGFLFDNFSWAAGWITGKSVSRTWELILPIGISFYTFQIVSYLVDVYRGSVQPERSLIRLGAYICMFPQLIAGPIVRYNQVENSLRQRSVSLEDVNEGVRICIIGIGYKVLLANRIGLLWHDVNSIGYESISTPLAWMAVAALSLQIYFDFYGYSLMAVGLGRIMGFRLPQNFRYPYEALSATDFWRRWHITLGSWFRDYVYIPLGGSRCGELKTERNLLVVWALTGFWHGASWNFILWGLLFFVLLSAERRGLRAWLERHPVIGHAYMIFLIPLSWTIFEVGDFSRMIVYFSRLFPFDGVFSGAFAGDFEKYFGIYGWIMGIGLLFCTPLVRVIWKRIERTKFSGLILLAVFWASVYCIYIGLNDPFLYFCF